MTRIDPRIINLVFASEIIKSGDYSCWAFRENCAECPWREGSGCYFQKHRPGNWNQNTIEKRFLKWAETHKTPDTPLDWFYSHASSAYGLVKAEKAGRWLQKGAYYKCSECGKVVWEGNNYCPGCGALMRGYEEEKA